MRIWDRDGDPAVEDDRSHPASASCCVLVMCQGNKWHDAYHDSVTSGSWGEVGKGFPGPCWQNCQYRAGAREEDGVHYRELQWVARWEALPLEESHEKGIWQIRYTSQLFEADGE